MRISDWSSDVCSSDLRVPGANVSLRDLRRWRDLRPPSRNRALRRLRQADFDRTRRSDRAAGREQDGGDLETAQRSEEHTSELQSLMRISYAVFCLKKKKMKTDYT